jgi:hypothetical protein
MSDATAPDFRGGRMFGGFLSELMSVLIKNRYCLNRNDYGMLDGSCLALELGME